MKNYAIPYPRLVLWLVSGLVSSSVVWAQTPVSAPVRSTTACPDGQYTGRPAKPGASYYKDNYVWAVSRDFAKRFCMPEEFIADDLKGAEAIAYRHGKPTGQEVCVVTDGKEICEMSRHGHWLEIYVKSGVVPKYDPQVGFYVRNYPTSKDVLGVSNKQTMVAEAKRNSDAGKRGETLEPPGQRRPYFGIGPQADGKRIKFRYLARMTPIKVDERSAALSEHYYMQNRYDGIDLIALESWSWGAIAGKDYPVDAPLGYAIGVTGEVYDAGSLVYPGGFLHVIELPQRIVRVLNVADRNGSKAFEEAVRNLGSSLRSPTR